MLKKKFNVLEFLNENIITKNTKITESDNAKMQKKFSNNDIDYKNDLLMYKKKKFIFSFIIIVKKKN